MGKSCWKVLAIVVIALAIVSHGYARAANEVVLRFLCFQVGVHPDAPWVERAVKDFNTEYAGKIKVVIDGVAGDQACWEKLRTDAAADTMPDIFMIKADRSEFNVLAQSGRVLDLTPYVRVDPALKARLNDKKSIATYSYKEQLLGIPFGKAYVGIFYNEDLFAKAGIEQFPVTWDEFFAVCEKLKKSGITPMSLMTGENAWCSALMIAHFLGTTPAGQAWLEGTPEEANFMDPAFIDAVAKLQVLLNKYTTPDAVGAGYGIAANYFLQSRTAMIANGPWMIGSFSDPKSAPAGFERKVSYALAPGGGAIAMENVGYASGSKTKVKQDAAIEFLKFLMREEVYAPYLSLTGQAPAIQVDTKRVTYNPINQEFIPKAVGAEFKYDIVPNVVKPAVIDSFCQLMPGLASRSMTPQEFARRCQEISDKN